jgi:DNA ligase-1
LEEVVSQIATSGLTDDERLKLTPVVTADSWESLARLRAESRARNVERFMLKRRGSPYHTGRVRGGWWKWKIEPYTVDSVLILAQRGSGKRASLYTDNTFGLWNEGKLVPVAVAYSGLTDGEIRQVDAL